MKFNEFCEKLKDANQIKEYSYYRDTLLNLGFDNVQESLQEPDMGDYNEFNSHCAIFSTQIESTYIEVIFVTPDEIPEDYSPFMCGIYKEDEDGVYEVIEGYTTNTFDELMNQVLGG